MRHILFSLLLMMALPFAMQGQNNDQLFKEVQEQLYLKDKATKVAFTSTVYDPDGEVLGSTTGTFILQGESFRLEYAPIVAVYQNALLAYHDSENQTLTFSHPSEEELLQINPLYFLKSKAKGFKTESLPESKTMQLLRFTPPNEDMNIRNLVVGFERSDKSVREVKILATDGTIFLLKVNAQQYIPLKEKSFFVLKQSAYPKSEFVDLR